MDNINIKSKKLSILNLNKRKSAAEISWDLFHEFKNLNGKNVFTDSELYKYPAFQFRLTLWLIHQNKCYNGLFTNNQEIIIPAETSDLVKIIGKRIKTHKENDEISVSFIPAAALLNLYVNPKKASNYSKEEKPYIINSDVYKNSIIVKYAEKELTKIIKTEYRKKEIKENKIYDTNLLNPTKRNKNTEGNIQENHCIIVEQNNLRLKNTDHRFILNVKILNIKSSKIRVQWFVNSLYDFEDYEKGYVTELPYDKEKGQVLTIPDGLSKHLVKINKAEEFWYGCKWEEDICVND